MNTKKLANQIENSEKISDYIHNKLPDYIVYLERNLAQIDRLYNKVQIGKIPDLLAQIQLAGLNLSGLKQALEELKELTL